MGVNDVTMLLTDFLLWKKYLDVEWQHTHDVDPGHGAFQQLLRILSGSKPQNNIQREETSCTQFSVKQGCSFDLGAKINTAILKKDIK